MDEDYDEDLQRAIAASLVRLLDTKRSACTLWQHKMAAADLLIV
jgi:hypothetical protein